MLRFKILASAVPVLIIAAFAHHGWAPVQRPCILVGEASVEIAGMPWRAELQVGFTDDPATANVRVQLTDNAASADFAVVDDAEHSATAACSANTATRLVAISAAPPDGGPLIYLSADGPADFRIFVRSTSFTAREAAALIVGASRAEHRLHAASL
jgi:hypothetical protein